MPLKTVTGKKCLITGAASGIGRATAIATAARGGQVFLTDIAERGLEEVAAQIRESAGRSATSRRSTSPTTRQSSQWPRRSTRRTAASTSS